MPLVGSEQFVRAILATPEEREAGRLAVLVADCRRKAKKARDKATDYARDNRPDSHSRACAKALMWDEIAARLEGSYVRPETEMERIQRMAKGPPSP